MSSLRLFISVCLLATCSLLPVHCQQRYQNASGVTPNHHSFRLTSPYSTSSKLWQFFLAAADCPPGISLHAVVTLPTEAPEGKTLTLTSSTGNCPASMVLCASTWRDATSDAVVKVDVVGEKGVRYDISFSPIIDRELTFEDGVASVNGTIRRRGSGGEREGEIGNDLALVSSAEAETYFLQLSNYSTQGGQMEISVESFDVPTTALGRKKDRATKRVVPRFVASLVVSADCHACSRRVKMGLNGEDNDADLVAASSSSPAPRLSFTTYGKITLSRQSIPNLDDGFWFISVIPSLHSDKDAALTKDFRLTVRLSSSVAQSKYVAPLVVVSLIVGFIFIIVDLFLLYVRYKEFSTNEAKSKAASIIRFILKNTFLYCYNCVCWFKRGTKTFPYLVLIFGVTLFIPGLQTIAGTLVQRWESGDLDLCYYNEKCYVAGQDFDYPQNSVVSNVAYIVHGILFVVLYSVIETYCRARGHFDDAGCGGVAPCKTCRLPPVRAEGTCDYSLAYALGWTLIFQGLFSAIYHLCPTRRAVQFDQSFMFVLAILIAVAVLRGTLKIIDFQSSLAASASLASSPTSSSGACPPQKRAKEMRSPKIFLFFLCPLVVFNYVGTLQNAKEIPVYGTVITPTGKAFFGIFLFAWIIAVLLWAAYKLRFKDRIKDMFFPDFSSSCCKDSAADSLKPDRPAPMASTRDKLSLLFCLLCFLIYSLFILYFVWSAFRQDDDMAKTFVSTTLISALASVAVAEILAAHFVWQQRRRIFRRYIGNIGLFYFLVVIAWGFAFWFFKKENPSKKEIEPWISRERNKDCIVGGYFDGHDVWHICSSFGIFLTCIRVVHLSNPCPICFKERFVSEPLKRVALAANAVARWKRRVSTLRRRGESGAGGVAVASADGVVIDINGRNGDEADERSAMRRGNDDDGRDLETEA